MVDYRTNYARDISLMVYDTYSASIKVFGSEIPMSVRASEVSVEGKSIYSYDPKGKVACAYNGINQRSFEGGIDNMANRVAGKIKLQSVDQLLGVPEIAGTQEIEIVRIHAFPNHPFKVLDDERMDMLVDSIRENGILNPVIVRPDQNGDYEMVSGHRRLHAAGIAGLQKIPAIVKEMSDDEAIINMVDANIQREEIIPE